MCSYSRGCRCEACKAKKAALARAWRRSKIDDVEWHARQRIYKQQWALTHPEAIEEKRQRERGNRKPRASKDSSLVRRSTEVHAARRSGFDAATKPLNAYRRWSPSQDAVVLDGSLTLYERAAALGRTYSGVTNRLRRLRSNQKGTP